MYSVVTFRCKKTIHFKKVEKLVNSNASLMTNSKTIKLVPPALAWSLSLVLFRQTKNLFLPIFFSVFLFFFRLMFSMSHVVLLRVRSSASHLCEKILLTLDFDFLLIWVEQKRLSVFWDNRIILIQLRQLNNTELWLDYHKFNLFWLVAKQGIKQLIWVLLIYEFKIILNW